jgi:hypothetical protein
MILKLTSGYRLDLAQIARIMDYCAQHRTASLSRQQVSDAIGLSRARVARLWMMGTALGLFRRGSWSISELGLLVRTHDRFLDDAGTLWLLHYILAGNPEIIVWNLMTNVVIPANRTITVETARTYFSDKMRSYSSLSYEVYLSKEIRSYLNAYTEQKLGDLSYLETEDGTTYVWGHKEPIPPAIAFACMLVYRDRFQPRATVMDSTCLTGSPNSVGRVFNLRERQVRDMLEEIEQLGHVYVETRADLDQIRLRSEYDLLDVVSSYYEDR